MSYVPQEAAAVFPLLKTPVRVASTANVTVSSPGSAIDGVTLTAGDRVLLKDQTTASQNGIYRFVAAASPMVRADDFNSSSEVFAGVSVYIRQGTLSAKSTYTLTTEAPITVGTTALTFEIVNVLVKSSSTPVGTMVPFAGSTAPTGWELCYGQAVSRTTYAELFAVISTTYGVGNGSTTFNLPDLRGRTAAGVDNMGGSDAGRLDWANVLGTVGGTQTDTLTTAQMPVHNHPVTDPGHAHGYAGHTYTAITGSGATLLGTLSASNFGVSGQAAGTGITVGNNGSGAAHNTMQPTILLNWIIKSISAETVQSLSVTPVGGTIDYYGTTEPTGGVWKFPNGQAISRTLHAELFNLIGTTYGVGDGSTTFNLPDLRGRVTAALDNMGGSDAGRLSWANTIGTVGGEETHLLTAAEAAQKAVTANASAVTGSITQYLGPTLTTYLPAAGSGVGGTVNTSSVAGISLTAAGQTITGSNAASAHNVMQPTMLVNKLLRVR